MERVVSYPMVKRDLRPPVLAQVRAALKILKNNLRTKWDDKSRCVHRLVVRMAAFQAVDTGSNPVERNRFYMRESYSIIQERCKDI